MSNEPARPSDSQPYLQAGSAWTVDTLKVYFDSALASQEMRLHERLTAQQEAIRVAYASQQNALDAALAAQQAALGAALAAQKSAVDAQFNSQKEAILKAEAANEKRFEATNEFRRTFSDSQATYQPKAEAQIQFRSLGEKVAELASRLDKADNRSAGGAAAYGLIVGAVGVVIAIVTFLWRFTG